MNVHLLWFPCYGVMISLYTIFGVRPSGCSMKRLSGELTLEQATYSWPCEKQGCLKSTPTTLRVWPWDLLIVIAKHTLTGNCRRLNWKGKSDGMRGMRGMRTVSPRAQPVKMIASMKCLWRDLTWSLVPLQSLGGCRFLSNIIGAPTFKMRLCWEMPGGLRVCRNSTG